MYLCIEYDKRSSGHWENVEEVMIDFHFHYRCPTSSYRCLTFISYRFFSICLALSFSTIFFPKAFKLNDSLLIKKMFLKSFSVFMFYSLNICSLFLFFPPSTYITMKLQKNSEIIMVVTYKPPPSNSPSSSFLICRQSRNLNQHRKLRS